MSAGPLRRRSSSWRRSTPSPVPIDAERLVYLSAVVRSAPVVHHRSHEEDTLDMAERANVIDRVDVYGYDLTYAHGDYVMSSGRVVDRSHRSCGSDARRCRGLR